MSTVLVYSCTFTSDPKYAMRWRNGEIDRSKILTLLKQGQPAYDESGSVARNTTYSCMHQDRPARPQLPVRPGPGRSSQGRLRRRRRPLPVRRARIACAETWGQTPTPQPQMRPGNDLRLGRGAPRVVRERVARRWGRPCARGRAARGLGMRRAVCVARAGCGERARTPIGAVLAGEHLVSELRSRDWHPARRGGHAVIGHGLKRASWVSGWGVGGVGRLGGDA